MTTILFADVTGRPRGEAVVLKSRLRRLATVLRPYRQAAEASGRPFIVSVHPAGELAYLPTDATVRVRGRWAKTMVGPRHVVLVTYLPLGGGGRGGGGGGKALQIGLSLASIALIALAPYAAPLAAGSLLGLGGAATGSLSVAIQAGMVVGGLALGYAAQASAAANKRQQQAQLYSISGGGNLPKPGGRKPLLYGRSWSAPPLSQQDYFLYDGDTMVITKRMTLGLGRFQVHRIRVGDATLWTEAAGILPPFSSTASGSLGTALEILYEKPSQLASGDVISSPSVAGQEMPRPGGNPDRTPWFRLTPQGVTADAALLSWTYPAVYRVTSKGVQVGTIAGVVFWARRVDPVTGNVIGAEFELHRSTELASTFTTTPLRRSAMVRLPQTGAAYEVCAANGYPDPVGFEQQNRSTWDAMAALRDDVRVRPNTTEIVLRFRAGKGLTITSYSDVMVEATRIVPVWNGSAWVDQATSKAVWAYADLVRADWGLAKPGGFDADRALHYAGELQALDTFDGALPEVSSFWEAAGALLLPMRADPVKVGNVLSFVRDESRDEPRHVLTRRNIVADSSRQSYALAAEGRGDVIVEFLRDGDPKRPDEARYSYGVPSRTPKRYKVEGIRDGLHALKHATWLAAIDVFRGAERSVVTEWDGRLIYPGDHVLSDLWFLKGKSVYGVASAAGRVLRLDVRASLSPDWGYGSVRTRVGREWGILRMRGAGLGLLELHPDDVAALEARSGLALAAVLARETQDPTTVVLGDLVELRETYVVRSAIPSDGDHVQIDMVADDPRVWQLLDEVVAGPVPVNADAAAEPLVPEITVLHARCLRIETGIEVVWGVSVTRGARNYEAGMSYDGGASWESLSSFGPASSGRAPMRQTSQPVTVRARAYGRTGLPGAWIASTFVTVAPVVSGALVDISTLAPITYDNLDGVISDRIKSVDGIKARAEEAYTGAVGALTRANDARAAADAARASASGARADATRAQADATQALADAQTAFQAAVDRSAQALSTALARLDGFRRALAADPLVRQGYVDPVVTDLRADLDILMRNATRNMQDIAGLRDALTTAGLELIPSEGRVRFYAIEALKTSVGETISNFSVTVDSLSRKIDLYGSIQGSDLQNLVNTISVVQTTLDAQQSAISNLASSAQFTALGARLATAEQTISAQDAAINARATTATVEAQSVRLTNAEQRISASEGRISQQVQATQSAPIDAELLPRTFSGFLDLLQRQQGALSQSLALATDALSANVDAAGRATAEVRTELLVYQGDAAAQFLSVTRAVADTSSALVETKTSLLARIGAADAAITTEAAARIDADAVTASRIDMAVARLGAAEAGITTEQQARAAADAASTVRIDTAISRIGASEGRIATAEAAITEEKRTRADADAVSTSQLVSAVARLGAAEAGITTEQQTRAAADAVSTTRIDGAYSRIAGTEASITTEQQTRASAEAAMTLRVDGALSRIAGAEAGITTEQQTRAAADAASTLRIDSAYSRIAGAEAGITTEAKTRADADGTLASRIDLVQSLSEGNEASIIAEARARASAESVQTTRIDGAISRIGASEGRIGSAEASITTEAKTRADADTAATSRINDLTSRFDAGDTRIGAVEARVVTEEKTRANADGAISSRIDNVFSRVGGAEAQIVDEQKTRADAVSSLANRVDVVSSRVSGVERQAGDALAQVVTERQARNDAVSAQAQRIDGVVADINGANSRITTVDQARADGDGQLASQIQSISTKAGANEAAITGEKQARIDADGSLASRIDQVSSRAENAISGVANEASARASADSAFAGQINDLYARSDNGTAYGRFSMQVQSAPSGVSVRLAAVASTESYGQRRNAGWYLDLLPDGTSRYVIDANAFAITANGGVSYPFHFDGSTLTIPNLRVSNSALIPGAVSQSDWHFSGGNSYLEFTVNCRPNSRVSIFAMFDGLPTTGIPINATGKLQIYRDGILLRETPISFYVAGSNQNLAAFTLNTTTFVRDTPGGGVHTYRIQNSSGQSPVSCTWMDMSV